jgi:hypothetical protein
MRSFSLQNFRNTKKYKRPFSLYQKVFADKGKQKNGKAVKKFTTVYYQKCDVGPCL